MLPSEMKGNEVFMGLGNTLNILIPLVIIGYALWLMIRMIRGRKKGKCSLGGCAGCPMEDGCKIASRMIEEETQKREEDPNEFRNE